MVKSKTKALRISLLLPLLITLLMWPNENEEPHIVPDDTIVILSPEELVKKILVPVPTVDNTLKKIAWCESGNRQFNEDGTVLRGRINSQDVGKYQINEHYHLEPSKELGFDIHTLAGNTAYAKHLYEDQGTKPWSWSEHCWGDPDRVWYEENGNLWSSK